MKKYVLWLAVLSAFLVPAVLRAGEEGSSRLEQLQEEARDPDSNVVWMLNEDGTEILYLDKKALKENGHKVVLGREKVEMAL